MGSPAHALGKRPAQSIGWIQAESAVPKKQVERLQGDFQWFSSLPALSPTPSENEGGELFSKAQIIKLMTAIMKIKTVEPQSLNGWLQDRVQFLLAENFPINESRLSPVLIPGFEFPKTPLPETFQSLEQTARASEAQKGHVVMTNIGTAIYAMGKQIGFPLEADLRGIGKVAVTSPRTGIIQIGEGLFNDKLFNGIDREATSRKSFRLSTFFHEARHSDGNGKSLGFFHSACPPGHTYEGQSACDASINGPYMIGALTTLYFLKSCTNCSEAEKELLSLMTYDDFSRVTSGLDASKAQVWDEKPEGKRHQAISSIKKK
jgi:hypothetical protein